jgi:hypothetical protein
MHHQKESIFIGKMPKVSFKKQKSEKMVVDQSKKMLDGDSIDNNSLKCDEEVDEGAITVKVRKRKVPK